MPPVDGLLETVLYADDLMRSRRFYEAKLGFAVMFHAERMIAFDLGAGQALLVFARGSATEPLPLPGGVVPPHDGHGPLHAAFRIGTGSLGAWRQHLSAAGIAIESEVTWPRGSVSLYFRDPDGHCLELATPGLWPNY